MPGTWKYRLSAADITLYFLQPEAERTATEMFGICNSAMLSDVAIQHATVQMVTSVELALPEVHARDPRILRYKTRNGTLSVDVGDACTGHHDIVWRPARAGITGSLLL